MSTAEKSRDADIAATITDDAIARMRTRLEVPFGRAKNPHNTEAHPDTIRHFAWATGDDNPLYNDPDYGSNTGWGGMIAPPFYWLSMGENEVGPLPDEVRRASKGALVGVHQFYAGAESSFYRPIRPGDRIAETTRLIDVAERTGRIAGGRRTVVTTNETEYQHRESREVYATYRFWFFHVERTASAGSGKESKVETPYWSSEEIEDIQRRLLAERPRGAEPRLWEETEIGEELPPLLKGPLTVSDMVALHIGWGTGGQHGWGPLRLAAQRRAEMRGFYSRDTRGVPDVVQRLHWDEAWAQKIGAARPYDYGPQRMIGLGHAVTDWMGDDGWLHRLRCEIRGFNYVGDLSTITGRVVDKPEPGVVELELECTNQRGVVTAPATATVLLPTRKGRPTLPTSPEQKWRPYEPGRP